MYHMKKIIALLLLCFVITNCEKDDICSADTGTTPKLILRFYDIADEEETKFMLEKQISSKSQLPELSRFDPQALAKCMRPGQVCKLERESSTALFYEFKRRGYPTLSGNDLRDFFLPLQVSRTSLRFL